MRVGDLIVLDQRSYLVDDLIGCRKAETLFLVQVREADTGQVMRLKLVYGERGLLERVHQEAKAQAQLGLPQLPEVFDLGVDEEKFWLLYAETEGLTLRQWLAGLPEEGEARVEAALPLCLSLCQAVERLHQKSISMATSTRKTSYSSAGEHTRRISALPILACTA